MLRARAAGFRVEYVRRGLVIGARDPASPTRTALDSVMYTELISATDMREYFPDGRLYWERFAGLPKSMTVIR